MLRTYQNNINKIKSLFPEIGCLEKFDFENKELYEVYFHFCQNDMLRNSTKLKGMESLFYYTPIYDINASADLRKNTLLLAINDGVIEKLNNLFNGEQKVYEQNSELMKWFGDLSNLLKISIGSIMYQCSTVFIYRHELTHLIQKVNKNSNSIADAANCVTKNGIYKKQIKEMDADISGTYFLCGQLIRYFESLEIEKRNVENLEKILSVGIASIYIYLLIYCKEEVEIYYNNELHPHPLIRLSYIVDSYILFAEKNLNNQLKINFLSIVNNCLNISEIFNREVMNSEIDINISNIFITEKIKIEAHIIDLLNASYELPELEMNHN